MSDTIPTLRGPKERREKVFVRLPQKVYFAVKMEATFRHKTIQDVISEAIERQLESRIKQVEQQLAEEEGNVS